MADIADPNDQNSPSAGDDALGAGNGNGGAENRGVKRARVSAAAGDDDDDDDDKPGRERRKIDIKFIQDKSRRHITFSKRKAGIMKKAYELSVLTGTQVLLLVVSETGLVYTFTTPKLQPLVTKSEGKNLIQACLNAPEPASDSQNGVGDDEPGNSPEDVGHAQVPTQQVSMPRNGGLPPQYGLTPEQQQQMAYQQYIQAQQQQSVGGNYPMPPQV
ncbi:transcription factor of the MADS box [Ptychographa xylographoides]|nr:transcription factor of the MADS box [Ptychographa xylographoides]